MPVDGFITGPHEMAREVSGDKIVYVVGGANLAQQLIAMRHLSSASNA